MIQLFSLAKRNPQANKSIQSHAKGLKRFEQDLTVQDQAKGDQESGVHKKQKLETNDLSQDNENLKNLFYSTKKEINEFYET